ncbi:centrosomal protein of 41 kDa isoform X1 [Pantherophis guttatus]|uniref:Centrosomal protein of 41 kDa isoform X1 n=1 Tax=Pantherophis guttatus TaxID=94885 RepID=A0A6P9B388_PANGU|nr:centrosomal protein of 41 kDa isoform X1 [Pantherophis guttatus]
MSARRRIGDPEFLTKRIPQNPKYQHVKTRLDTGSSMTKYTEKLEEIKRNYRYKKDELFKRLKVSTFAQLVIQVATLSDETLKGPPEEGQKLDEGDAAPAETSLEIAETNGKGSPEEKPASPILFINNTGAGESYRSTLQSVISGVGELDLGKGDPKETEGTVPNNGPYPDCPYLLLDVRERDAYDQCHLVGAHSYPIATLSRTMNPYTNSILEYKNAHGKIIILYDDDERVASQAASTMCERGFENLFMLSGGLRVIAQKIPEGLVTGSFPASCLVSSQSGNARKKATPQPPLPQTAENKWRFTAEDLQKIQYYLQEEQLPSDPASRLSRGSSARDCKAVAVKSNQNLPSTNPATAPLTTRSLSSSSLQSRPWR